MLETQENGYYRRDTIRSDSRRFLNLLGLPGSAEYEFRSSIDLPELNGRSQ